MSDQDENSRRPARFLPSTPADISLVEEDDALVMRTEAGFALYRYDRDADGQSRCIDACSKDWPPVLVPVNANRVDGWTMIRRPDGIRQWAYRGKPVYTYAKDTPGRRHGDGIGGVWHLVTP